MPVVVFAPSSVHRGTHVYPMLTVTPFAQRLLPTNCSESYFIEPRLMLFVLKQFVSVPTLQPLNAGNGRDSSKRDSCELVKRVVPSKPGTLKNGFVSSWSQRERLPPRVTSHCAWNAADGSLKPWKFPSISWLRLAAYVTSSETCQGSSRCTPTENWSTFGTMKSGFEKLGLRPRNVSAPSELPGGF